MGKRVVLTIVLVVILFASLISVSAAVEGEEAKIDKAYQCLKDRIDDASKLSFIESVFGTMALGKYDGLFGNITKEKKNNEWCWPAAGCKLKETAQVLLAYDQAGERTADIEKWLLSKNGTTTDLSWFIEIDAEKQQSSTCTIKWDTTQTNIVIDSNMKLTGNPGSCLRISTSGYLLKITDACIEKKFDISCNNTFVTTLLYQKNGGDQSDCLSGNGKTCYVIGETHSAASLGTTTEQVKASCFKNGATCDYEGSLWAALALATTGRDISQFMPYLLALAEDNQRLFPDSFLYTLIRDSNAFTKIIELRRADSYWEIGGSPYNRYYDTALGMIALSGFSNTIELDKTKEYLLKIQTREGCWNNNNIKDTAFILYAGWKRGGSHGNGGGNGELGGTSECLSVANARYDCSSQQECNDAGGQILPNFLCSGVSKCCSVRIPLKSCTELGGNICLQGKQCSQGAVSSSDGSCCPGDCEDFVQEETCSDRNGECKATCSDSENQVSYSCSASASVCCVQKEETSGGSNWWIWILAILIILIIVAIIYRHRIQAWWFNYQKKRQAGKGGATSVGRAPGPGLPVRPMMPVGRPMARPIPPRGLPVRPATKVIGRTNASKNKELDDTLKKLRDIGR